MESNKDGYVRIYGFGTIHNSYTQIGSDNTVRLQEIGVVQFP